MDDGETAEGGRTKPAEDVRKALALHRAGAVDEARAACEAILRDRPDDYDALSLTGLLALRAGALKEALSRFEAAAAVHPEIASCQGLLALTLQQLNRPRAALQHVEQALALAPEDVRALSLRGRILKTLGRPEEAAASYRQALAINPRWAPWHNSLGVILVDLRCFNQALESFDQALAIKPDYAEAHTNRGHALVALGRAAEAIASHDRAMAINPALAGARVNRAFALLSLGRFEGWRDLEARKWPQGIRPLPTPLWLGEEDIAGRTLLIISEQGLGDTIQFCRFLPMLEQRGARVLFSPQKPLTRLLAPLGPKIELVDADDADLPHDFHAPLMSLPLALGTTLDTIPAQKAWLSAEPARVAEWTSRLGRGGFKIGISWQGSRTAADAGRSFPVAAFARIAALSGVRLISLQKGYGAEQLQSLPEGMTVEVPGPDFDAGDQAFLDTAAVMESCDLVITSDTAVAHLAGALGRPTWVVLQYSPDWRWLRDRDDSPWYPTLRLFRQTSPDDWSSAFDAVENALRELL